MPGNRAKPDFYAVAKGRKPGIYIDWTECKAQIQNYYGAKYKKFPTPFEAQSWIEGNVGKDVAHTALDDFLETNPEYRSAPEVSPQTMPTAHTTAPIVPTPVQGSSTTSSIGGGSAVTVAAKTAPALSASIDPPPDGQPWVVYSDGSSRGNGKAGAVAGVGVWWGKDDPRNICERCPGDQTNNRAELIAIIRVLETAPIDKRPLVIKTDSAYSINALSIWLPGWKSRGWRKADGKPVLNVPLIKYADTLLQQRREHAKQPVELVKVLGHSGDEGNDGADRLANLGATKSIVPDRDWEDLIRQARANTSLLAPPVEAAASTQDHSAHPKAPAPQAVPADGSAQGRAQTAVGVPTPAQDARTTANTIQSSSTTGPAFTDQRVVVPRRSKPTSASKQAAPAPAVKSPSPPQQIVYGDLNAHISPEELALYADCLLSDDEFLDEAEELLS